MMAFGLASIMLLLGVIIRAKVKFFRNMLVPASVIAGIIGMVFMNICIDRSINVGADAQMFTNIVNNLFTVSFISITLTSTTGGEKSGNQMLKGALGMGLVWDLLYALTPIIGFVVILALGGLFKMDAIYGMLVQFAFCQGPGQSAAYGEIFEGFGWQNATTVAVFYSTIGFIVAFLLGIPFAKMGIKKSYAKHAGKIDESILKGYLTKEEQVSYMVKDTTCNSNVETIAFHLALIGLCYVIAVGIGKVFSLIPGFLGTSMSAMMFMNGMYAAYIVKFLMKKLGCDFLLENTLQSKITGFTSDYLVVCAFMSVSIKVIKNWMVPILVVSVIITAITFVLCLYFGKRMGGECDFERTLGMYGMCTGTVPTGIALVRIVDPDFKTTTAAELGAANLIMILSAPVYIVILAYASGTINAGIALAGLLVCVVIYAVALKLTKTWGKKTYG